MFGRYGHMMFGGGFMMLFPLILIGIAFYLLIRTKSLNINNSGFKDKLNEKFINNEITKEEYEEKMAVLKKNK